MERGGQKKKKKSGSHEWGSPSGLGRSPREGVLKPVEQGGLGNAKASSGSCHGYTLGEDGAQGTLHLLLCPARVAAAPGREQ